MHTLMITIIKKFILVLICLLQLLNFTPTQGKTLLELNNVVLGQNNTTNFNNSSPWLTRVKNPRAIGCRFRPWICNQDFFPRIRMRCCRDRCIDVTSDPNNCGLCGIRCPFTWQFCRGLCVNTRFSPFNCGRCFHRCPFPSFCLFGICNYAQPLPPFPFPFPPPRPFPPKPPFPPIPFPPRPPKPFPPKPPKPFPPKPPKPFSPKPPRPPKPPKPFPPKPHPPKGPPVG